MTKTDGFVRIPNWLIDDSDLKLPELGVYMVLLRYRNPKTGRCFPGMATIADAARISKRSVIRAIEGLEERGAIRVERRSTITHNQPNVYHVALPSEETRHIWTSSQRSARGTRIPKRKKAEEVDWETVEEEHATSDSESAGSPLPGQADAPSDSESLPSDRTHIDPVTPSHPKNTKEKKTNEQDVTPTFVESGSELSTFDVPDPDKATERQVAYLKDLAIHLGYQTGGGVPNDLQMQRWRKLTRDDATKQIKGYLKALGRPDDIYYPQDGDPEFEALSDAGRAFAESAGDPASVFDYAFVQSAEHLA